MKPFTSQMLITLVTVGVLLAGCSKAFEDGLATAIIESEEFRHAMFVMADREFFESVPADATVVIVDDLDNPEFTAYRFTGTEERQRFLSDRFRENWWTTGAASWSKNAMTARDIDSLKQLVDAEFPDVELIVNLSTIIS